MKINLNETKTAAILTRSATNQEALATQETACRELAEKNSYAVTNVYKMIGLGWVRSGRNKRNLAPELNKLLDDTKAHKFDIIIVTSLDRFSGDSRVLLPMIYSLKVRANIDVLSADGTLDTRQIDWKLTLSMLGVLAEHEHTMISQRVKKSWERRKAATMVNK